MINNLNFKQLNWISTAYVKFVQRNLVLKLGKIFVFKTNIVIKVVKSKINNILFTFKNHSLLLYKQLIDIAVEDTPKQKNRFRVNYILTSISYNTKVIVSTTINEITYLPTVSTIFSSAFWLEREVWDLFGIYFKNNKELRRILTDYGFSGHPLRKDFPMTGFTEIYYSFDKKRIVTVPVELTQEYRVFTL